MKSVIYFFLNRMMGKKKFYNFFLVLKNIGLQGMNYRNTNIDSNGELYLMTRISKFYKNSQENLFVFDIGANIGNYSKKLISVFGNKMKLYAFEPFSSAYNILKSIETNNVNCLNVGFSNKANKLEIYTSEEFSEVGGLYNRFSTGKMLLHNKTEVCEFKTIDDFCNGNKINKIHFMKIDVEGHEFLVLEGARSMIENSKIDHIQFEFGAGNTFSKTYFKDFFEFLNPNYNLFLLLKDDLLKIEEYHSDFEIHTLVNFVAISKKISN